MARATEHDRNKNVVAENIKVCDSRFLSAAASDIYTVRTVYIYKYTGNVSCRLRENSQLNAFTRIATTVASSIRIQFAVATSLLLGTSCGIRTVYCIVCTDVSCRLGEFAVKCVHTHSDNGSEQQSYSICRRNRASCGIRTVYCVQTAHRLL